MRDARLWSRTARENIEKVLGSPIANSNQRTGGNLKDERVNHKLNWTGKIRGWESESSELVKLVMLTVNNKGINIKFSWMSKCEIKIYSRVSITLLLNNTPIKDYVSYGMGNDAIIKINSKRELKII